MADIILLDQIQIGPSDFAAYSDDIDMCACEPCLAANAQRSLDHFGYQRLVACVALLELLKSGRHQRRTFAQAAADARAKTIVNGTYGRTVIKFPFSDTVHGAGIGMTPGRYTGRPQR